MNKIKKHQPSLCRTQKPQKIQKYKKLIFQSIFWKMQTYIGKLITAREYCIKYHFRAPVIECNLFIRKNISW